MSPTLAELTEAELLRRLARFAPPNQLSDDTAALAADARPLLINTDVLVDGIHFSDATTTAMDVGWRAVAANLSDLAASGAVDIDGITVALVAPGHTSWDWVDGVYQGISAARGSTAAFCWGVTAPKESRDCYRSQRSAVWDPCVCIAMQPALAMCWSQVGPMGSAEWASPCCRTTQTCVTSLCAQLCGTKRSHATNDRHLG